MIEVMGSWKPLLGQRVRGGICEIGFRCVEVDGEIALIRVLKRGVSAVQAMEMLR